MKVHTLLCILVAIALGGCQSPYKKKDDEDKKPMKDQSGDTSFQAFLGRLKIAVSKRDTATLVSMMAGDFGYRWDTPPAGEDVFTYWDQNNVWPELNAILRERFAAKELYMVAPSQAVSDSEYRGYRAGMRVIGGSWKFAYFVPGEGAP